MSESSRSTRWRQGRVAQGGKAVGVTLEPGAASALAELQETFAWSQRQAISVALEFAARRKEELGVSEAFPKSFLEAIDPLKFQEKIHELEARLESLEKALENSVSGALEPASPTAGAFGEDNFVFAPNGTDQTTLETDDAARWSELLDCVARQMLEHGERAPRHRLFDLARHEGVPHQQTLHEFSAFVSLNMNRIRDRMRQMKEG